MEEIKKAAIQITKSMKESEAALTKVARGESAEPKPVDVNLPPPNSSNPPPPPAESQPGSGGGGAGGSGGGGGLQGSGEQGRQVVEGINRIIENAAKLGGGQPSSGGGGKPQPQPQDGESEDGKDPKNQKKGPDEKKDPLKDNEKPDGKGDPKSGEKSKEPPQDPKDLKSPPPTPKGEPNSKDPRGVFFAQLPAKVREAVLAGDFDQVPERYRDLIREWTKKLAEKEAEDAAKK